MKIQGVIAALLIHTLTASHSLAAEVTAAAADSVTETVTETATQAPALEGYRLVWSDEFEASGRPDLQKWGFERGFVRNEEHQWYQPENATVESGLLVIEGRNEEIPIPKRRQRWGREVAEYTSASLKTQRKYEWLYGVLEVRAKIDAQPGLWPAIWTLGSARRWPGCGEVDLMEYYDNSLLANGVVAGRRGKSRWDATKTPLNEFGDEKWADSFHVWRMDWNADRIKLSVDGRLLNEIDVEDFVNETRDKAHPFREPHYLLLNLAIGGTQGGDPSQATYPTRYEIDYVRIYQQDEPVAATAAE